MSKTDRKAMIALAVSAACLPLTAFSATYNAGNLTQLQTYLNSAGAGDTVRLTSSFSLDSAPLPLTVNPGVTLDGNNRTLSYSKRNVNVTLIRAGDEATIKNTTLVGPFKNQIYVEGTDKLVKGITTAKLNGQYWVDVDVLDSSIEGFATGIEVGNQGRLYVTGTDFKDNDGTNFGYGINLGGDYANANIYNNDFYKNRHAIAAKGSPYQEYEAHYNTVHTSANSHSFDVHQYCGHPSFGCVAGKSFKIHHNTFHHSEQQAIAIRGIPRVGAEIYDNTYQKSTGSLPSVMQINWDRITPYNGKCTDKGSTIVGAKQLKAMFSAQGALQSISDQVFTTSGNEKHIAFANMDNGNSDDVFFLDAGNRWRKLSYAASGDELQCAELVPYSSTLPSNGVIMGNFDGQDSIADMFVFKNNQWQVRYGSYSNGSASPSNHGYLDLYTLAEPVTIQTSVHDVDELKFGDLNGDGVLDVFIGTGHAWRVSYGSQNKGQYFSSWQTIKSTSYRTHQVAIGNFIGDSADDVLIYDGAWKVSDSGTGPFVQIRSSGYPISQLGFGDFNGNGLTDIFIKDGASWKVSDDGSGSIRTIMTNNNTALSKIRFGDINGDNKDDILVYE